jgi:hypothetical protein
LGVGVGWVASVLEMEVAGPVLGAEELLAGSVPEEKRPVWRGGAEVDGADSWGSPYLARLRSLGSGKRAPAGATARGQGGPGLRYLASGGGGSKTGVSTRSGAGPGPRAPPSRCARSGPQFAAWMTEATAAPSRPRGCRPAPWGAGCSRGRLGH